MNQNFINELKIFKINARIHVLYITNYFSFFIFKVRFFLLKCGNIFFKQRVMSPKIFMLRKFQNFTLFLFFDAVLYNLR
jgi:hypothetical protein